MKFLAIFLSVIMLAMAFDICPDTDSCGDSDKTELSKDTGEQPDESELCSPFCYCLRCPFSVLLPVPMAELSFINSGQKKYIATSESSTLSVQNTVWQPPRAV